MKDTGKSSSRKLRRVIYYTLYRMDPQKTHYKISFSAKMSKIKNWGGKKTYIFPPNSRSTAPLRRLFMSIDTLWKPSTVTVGTGLQVTASDASGTLQLDLTGTESRSQLKLIDSQNTVRSLIPSVTGTVAYNGSTLVDLTYLSNNFTTSSSM